MDAVQGCTLPLCRLHRAGAVWQLPAGEARLRCGVAHPGGDLELQHQLLLCQPDPQLAGHQVHHKSSSEQPLNSMQTEAQFSFALGSMQTEAPSTFAQLQRLCYACRGSDIRHSGQC